MKPNKGNATPLNLTGIIFLACLVILTLGLGILGFSSVYVANPEVAYPVLTRWFDVIYSTIKLFSLLSSPADDELKHWAISAARLTAACSVFFSIAFATIYAAGSWFKANVGVRFYKRHFVIFGLNEESKYLIDDLIKQNKKVVVVESDHANTLLPEYKKQPVTILLGDSSQLAIQKRASILNAHCMVAMTGCDLENLAILKALVEAPYKPKLHCHIAIENVMSYKLFEPNAFYAIENIKKLSTGLLVNIFNKNEQIAINLVAAMKLGSNGDTASDTAQPVSILLAGFGAIGVAILRELLLMAHFCNHKKAKIVILSPEPNDFFVTHHQVLANCNGNGLDLWDIEFVTSEQELQAPSSFNHIIACDQNENLALKSILRLYDMCTISQMRETDSSTTFHYLSMLKHDIKHTQIQPFGSLESTLNGSALLNNKNETLAEKSHHLYARAKLGLRDLSDEEVNQRIELHDAQSQDSSAWLHWVNQPLFKRRSNFTEKRHIPIKLLALGGETPIQTLAGANFNAKQDSIDLPYLDEFSDLDFNVIYAWMDEIKTELGLDNKEITQRIHALARVEHDRWNAFHVVNNWRYGASKNEVLKTHDCLLSWQQLEQKRPDTIKYDYKAVYHIPESLALLNDKA
ncbi:NAD-binding protein [Glaciecola sp. 1036]|uniref:NAD-binding protein n=1 Tax=Alteromonadaceae TaxID=72275 RepID=UPI003D02D39C